ncbi:MAG: polysaccharide deacetylase family protein [Pyrinomonadaceae bacterium]
MNVIALMYHDIVEAGKARASGFASADADIYKLDKDLFEKHLNAIEGLPEKPSLVTNSANDDGKKLLLTFDDGGRSAYTHIADALEMRGWRGHFVVATDFIDTPTFLSRAEICELHERGHIIGSHSASHPLRMSACSLIKMREEWKKSTEKLAAILGQKITVASVPGGHFSKKVARAAAENGIETLFNSEPVTRVHKIENCRIIGRYSIQRQTTTAEAAAIAQGKISPRLRQYFFWNAKKIAKKIGGEFYLEIRKRILSKR